MYTFQTPPHRVTTNGFPAATASSAAASALPEAAALLAAATWAAERRSRAGRRRSRYGTRICVQTEQMATLRGGYDAVHARSTAGPMAVAVTQASTRRSACAA